MIKYYDCKMILTLTSISSKLKIGMIVFQSTRLRFAHVLINIEMVSTISTKNMDKFSCVHMPIDFDTISTINKDSFCSVHMPIDVDTKFK